MIPPLQAEARPAAFLGEPPRGAWDLLLKTVIVLGLIGLVGVTYRAALFASLLQVAQRHGVPALLVKPSVVWLAMGTTLLLFRTLLWFGYRPPPVASLDDAPTLTIVIPAFNEGPMVAQAIDTMANAHYPAGRLEIFVVEDGSTDDTWHHMQLAAARHGGRVKAIRLPHRQGKRHALAEGFRRSTGEVLVTIDSDGVIQPQALLALAGPFADPRVGVVAGRVLVLNRCEGGG